MPTVEIDLWEGRTLDQKRTLVKNVTQAIMDSLGCPAEAVSIKIVESKKEHSARAGVLAIDR